MAFGEFPIESGLIDGVGGGHDEALARISLHAGVIEVVTDRDKPLGMGQQAAFSDFYSGERRKHVILLACFSRNVGFGDGERSKPFVKNKGIIDSPGRFSGVRIQLPFAMRKEFSHDLLDRFRV